ncbi:MAG: glutamate ABC transporter substrate-binding protein [Streptomyces sp.]
MTDGTERGRDGDRSLDRRRRARYHRHARYARQGKPLAVAAGGLAVVAAVLVPAVLPVHGTHDTDARTRVTGRSAAAQQTLRPAAAPRPETCEDGNDPAESLKPSGDAGAAVKRIKEKGQLVVGVDQNSYLWGYRDPATGDIEGFDIDLVRAIAEDLFGETPPGEDPPITFKTIPTDQRIPAIRSGDVDMVVRTMTVNCERLKDVAFSTAYFEAGQQLLVPKKRARVKGFDASMRGERLCFAQGSTAQTLMKRGRYRKLGAESVVVPNQLDCLVRMQLGQADATLTDSALGAGQAAQDPTVELIGDPVTVEPYGVAMNLADEDLVRRVNKVLEDYREGGSDSAWRTSYDKWLADDIGKGEGKASPPKPKYRN